MIFVSVTRLRLRGLRWFPGFGIRTWRAQHQLVRADGFLGGYLGSGGKLTFWTVTFWRDEASMKAYRDSGQHQRAMPFLSKACDEAAVTHFSVREPPSAHEAAAKIATARLSRVKHPSPAHTAGQAWPDAKLPFFGPIRPRATSGGAR